MLRPLTHTYNCSAFSDLCFCCRWWGCTCKAWAPTRCCRALPSRSKWALPKQTLTRPLPSTRLHLKSLSQCANANIATTPTCLLRQHASSYYYFFKDTLEFFWCPSQFFECSTTIPRLFCILVLYVYMLNINKLAASKQCHVECKHKYSPSYF